MSFPFESRHHHLFVEEMRDLGLNLVLHLTGMSGGGGGGGGGGGFGGMDTMGNMGGFGGRDMAPVGRMGGKRPHSLLLGRGLFWDVIL